MKNPKYLVLFSIAFIGGICMLLLPQVPMRSAAATTLIFSQSSQSQPPLTRIQIEEAIKKPLLDIVIAREIERRGLSFEVTEDILQELRKLGAGPRTIQSLPCPTDSSKYGFENAAGILWKAQASGDSQAITGVSQSEKWKAKSGCHSLKLTVGLIGGHLTKSKGEAYIDLVNFPPSGIKAPLNLEGVEIAMWVFVPGNAKNNVGATGLRVFVKDQAGKSEYGRWYSLSGFTDKWIPISLVPSKAMPEGGHKDDGFDPTTLIHIGINIGSDTNSTATYSGPIYVDGVNWCPPDTSKYGFEKADEKWENQTYKDSQAVTAVNQSKQGMAKFGCYSLELTVDLVGAHANKSKGEAYVNLVNFPPSGIKAPLNLEGIEITIWVFAPKRAIGDSLYPNGLQVFVKDQQDKSEYGSWVNLTGKTDQWVPIKLIPSKVMPKDGHKDPDFDPTILTQVGIKIGSGSNSTATYAGPIYVDGVNWNANPPKVNVPTPTCPPDSSKFGFEKAGEKWEKQTYKDSQAVTAVNQSQKKAKFGCYSLELIVDLQGGHANKSKGEVYTSLRRFAPSGNEPLNLEGTEITIWVFVPEQAAGDPDHPNGVQVFVKDQRGKSQYGTWVNLTEQSEGWIPVRLVPSKETPPAGYKDEDFDPTKLVTIGLKIAAGTDSTATYSGPIYVDGVGWSERR
jgi:hypothetical protein